MSLERMSSSAILMQSLVPPMENVAQTYAWAAWCETEQDVCETDTSKFNQPKFDHVTKWMRLSSLWLRTGMITMLDYPKAWRPLEAHVPGFPQKACQPAQRQCCNNIKAEHNTSLHTECCQSVLSAQSHPSLCSLKKGQLAGTSHVICSCYSHWHSWNTELEVSILIHSESTCASKSFRASSFSLSKVARADSSSLSIFCIYHATA